MVNLNIVFLAMSYKGNDFFENAKLVLMIWYLKKGEY